jgi:type I restriction enzyme R subunit
LKKTQEQRKTKDALTSIFLNRVNLLSKNLDDGQKKIISEKILETVNSFDEESFIVREKLPIIKKIKSQPFDLKKYIKELEEEIAPLIVLQQSENANITSFILQSEKLFKYIIDQKNDSIQKTREDIELKLENVMQKSNLTEVKNKKKEIIYALQEDFWNDLTFEKVNFLIKELAPLMRFYEPVPKKILQVDAPDLLLDIRFLEKEIKEDPLFHKFLDNNPLIKKFKKDEGITSQELMLLEQQMAQIKPEFTIDKVQRYYKKDFIQFVREISGLKRTYDPRVLIEREFDKYIIEKSCQYNSKQLEFLTLLKKVFANQKHLEMRDFAKPPLSDENPLDKFEMSQLREIINRCNQLKLK